MAQTKTITGVVVDATGEPVIGASVLEVGTTNGTITDVDGNFTIQVPVGAKLDVSYIGYKTQQIVVGVPNTYKVILKEDAEMLDEVVVTGYGMSQKRSLMTNSISKLDDKVLQNAAMSNAAQSLQGTVSGLRVTNTSGKPGSSPNIVLRGGASINKNLEGPLVKDRTSFNFALRRSWIDALSAPTIAIWNATRNKGETQIVARYAFTDMNFKLNHQFNDRSRGYAGLYWGNDFLKGGEKREGDNGYESRNTGRLRWGNIMAFTGWSYVFNNQLFGNVNAAFTHYSSTLKGDYYQGTEANYVSQESSTRNRIDDLSIRANFDFRPNASHQLHFGTHYIYHRFHPVDEKSHFSNGMTTQTRQNNDTALPAHELGIYMEEDWKMNKRIRLNAGVHLGLYTIDGKTYTSLEPRFSSRFLINPQLSLKASYTRMSQYVHQVNESYINLPTDTWIPVSRKLKPMQSDQLAVGAYYTTGNKIYSFSIEGYYKWMKHLMDYKDNYQFLPPSTSWEDKLTQGKGRSYGVELIARKEKGKITGWAGYTLSWNDRQFTEINKGKRFPAKFDNRHKFNIIANWKIKPKLELTGSWTYATGNRLTVSFENYQAVSPQHPFPGGSLVPPYIDPGGLDYYTERNNFQLPAYHRLDLGINIYRPKKKNRMGIWNISIYNVYSYMAPVSIRKGWWYNNDCFYTLGIVPIIPSVSYTYKF